MARRDYDEEVRCPSCSALNVVTYKYSDFSPANQERETGECAACGVQIASAKCLSIWTRLAEPEATKGA